MSDTNTKHLLADEWEAMRTGKHYEEACARRPIYQSSDGPRIMRLLDACDCPHETAGPVYILLARLSVQMDDMRAIGEMLCRKEGDC